MPATLTNSPSEDLRLNLSRPRSYWFEQQLAFRSARQTHRARHFVGGRQSGKTDVGADEAKLFSLVFRPGQEGAIIGPDYPRALEAKHRFEEAVPYELRTFNHSERIYRVRCPGGETSMVHWMSMSNADAARGKVLSWAWADEEAMYSEEAVNNLRPALAVKNGHLFGTSTPRGQNWLARECRRDDVFFVHAESRDNPAFPDHEWQAAIDRYGYDSPFFRQEYRGLFVAFVGQAFPMFDRKLHVAETEWSDDLMTVYGWDFGWTAPTVALALQVDVDENKVIKGCKLWTETDPLIVLAQCDINKRAAAAPHCVDPAGSARSARHDGWISDMRSRGFDVRLTRRVSEAAGMNLIRADLNQGKLTVDPRGENAETVIAALETAELDDNPEKDTLKADQHPQADIVDALRYPYANLFNRRPAVKVTRH